MPYAILVVERPISKRPIDENPFSNLVAHSKDIVEKATGVETLAENVWQIDLASDVVSLSRLLSAAEGSGLKYRVLFLDDEPAWCHSSPKPKL